MTDLKPYINNTFGYLTIKDFSRINGRLYAECDCLCGVSKLVRFDGIKKGVVISCGCKRHTDIAKKHGCSGTRLYHIWQNMKSRCYNPKNYEYKNYGERGIKICSAWKDFKTFRDWAINNGYTDNLTIERKDVNGNYCEENCKWITRSEQLKNTTKTVFITYNGETLCAKDWSDKLGIPNNVLIHRYRSGLPLDKVLSTANYRGKNFKKDF